MSHTRWFTISSLLVIVALLLSACQPIMLQNSAMPSTAAQSPAQGSSAAEVSVWPISTPEEQGVDSEKLLGCPGLHPGRADPSPQLAGHAGWQDRARRVHAPVLTRHTPSDLLGHQGHFVGAGRHCHRAGVYREH